MVCVHIVVENFIKPSWYVGLYLLHVVFVHTLFAYHVLCVLLPGSVAIYTNAQKHSIRQMHDTSCVVIFFDAVCQY